MTTPSLLLHCLSKTMLLAALLVAELPSTQLRGQQASAPSQATLASARALVGSGRFEEAEMQLHRVLENEGQSADAAYLLAYVLFREQKLPDSLAAYTEAARLRPPTAPDLRAIAAVYVLLKDFGDAEHWLLEATRLAPNDADTWYLLGRTQYNDDHAALAIRSFERALLLRPRDARTEYNLGLAYEALQRTDNALAAYRTAIEWQRAAMIRDPQPFLDLGILLLRQQHPEEALAPLQNAVEQGPNNPLAQQEFGLVLEALGRYAEGLIPLQRAAQLSPEADQPHFFWSHLSPPWPQG